MPIVTSKIPWYAFGMGGRIFDLPPNYQRAVADIVTNSHPRSIKRRAVIYCLVCGRFNSSVHPRLAKLTADQVYELCRSWERGAPGRRRRDRELALTLFASAPTCDTIDDKRARRA